MTAVDLRIDVGERIGTVSGLLLRPPDAWVVYALAHGAGAGMRHRFMDAIARHSRCAGWRRCATSFPSPRQGVVARIRRACSRPPCARRPRGPRARGGPSARGGRQVARRTDDLQCAGASPADRRVGSGLSRLPAPSAQAAGERRAEHLRASSCRCCSCRGRATSSPTWTSCGRCAIGLGARATLHVVEGADHGFEVLKRSGRTDAEVMEELAETVAGWCRAARP